MADDRPHLMKSSQSDILQTHAQQDMVALGVRIELTVAGPVGAISPSGFCGQRAHNLLSALTWTDLSSSFGERFFGRMVT
jgi:hypothetical protein